MTSIITLQKKLQLLGLAFLFFILNGNVSFASQTLPGDKQQTICLNMIVKDEKDVIERCLASVKPLIDYWVIVDTGSTDGTQEIIKNFMKDTPGELYERPWKNFGHNRNEALALASSKGDYLLFVDADEVFEYENGYKFPKFEKNCYFINTNLMGLIYKRPLIVKANSGFVWKGVLHETLYGPEPIEHQPLVGIVNIPKPEGSRSKDPKKFEKDAAIFEDALKDEPNNSRYVFYLAQSYRDAGLYSKAIENYKKRVLMKGWDQEVFYSLLQIAILEELKGASADQIVDNYYQAYQIRTSRAEPLYYLAKYYRDKKNYAACYTLSKLGMMLPCPQNDLFVEKWIYDYGLLIENSVAAYWLDRYLECQNSSKKILAMKNLPEHVQACVKRNLAFADQKLSK